MLDYAVKLTQTPSAVTDLDVEALRGQGFTDTAILDIVQVTSYYNYVNRLADGLGVEMEDVWTVEELTLSRDEYLASTSSRPGEGDP
jgi:uncharacterized protein YciW